jgi:hypothetical protein
LRIFESESRHGAAQRAPRLPTVGGLAGERACPTLYNLGVRIVSIVLALLSLAACNRGTQSKEAVRQAVIERLGAHGLNVSGMNVDVTSVQFNGSQADAVVSITPKGGPSGNGMSMGYHLEQQNGKWTVTGTKDTGGTPHGAGAAAPGVMPGGENPHGGAMAPAGGSNMPAPEDLPPAGKKK